MSLFIFFLSLRMVDVQLVNSGFWMSHSKSCLSGLWLGVKNLFYLHGLRDGLFWFIACSQIFVLHSIFFHSWLSLGWIMTKCHSKCVLVSRKLNSNYTAELAWRSCFRLNVSPFQNILRLVVSELRSRTYTLQNARFLSLRRLLAVVLN